MFERLREMRLQRRYGHPIIAVSGLPRSGTSMVMRMLATGGIDLAQDGVREADTDNPHGYFELEQVKRLDKPDDPFWLRACRGKAVKVVSPLLKDLPPENRYSILFVRRDLDEVLASQRAMLQRRGETADASEDGALRRHYETHLRKVGHWMSQQTNIQVIDLSHRDIIEHPADNAERIRAFLRLPLDVNAMAQAVDPALYRNRG